MKCLGRGKDYLVTAGDIVEKYINLKDIKKKAAEYYKRHGTPEGEQRVVSFQEDEHLLADELLGYLQAIFKYKDRLKTILQDAFDPNDLGLTFNFMKKSLSEQKKEDREIIGDSMIYLIIILHVTKLLIYDIGNQTSSWYHATNKIVSDKQGLCFTYFTLRRFYKRSVIFLHRYSNIACAFITLKLLKITHAAPGDDNLEEADEDGASDCSSSDGEADMIHASKRRKADNYHVDEDRSCEGSL